MSICPQRLPDLGTRARAVVPLRPAVVVDEGGRDGAAVAVQGVHVKVVLEAEDADRVVLRSQDRSCC